MNKFLYKITLLLIFILCVNSTSYSSSSEYDSFIQQPSFGQTQNDVYHSEIPDYSSMENYSGLSYSPFSAESYKPVSGPVLYGPGGDPIGGLPVNNGVLTLLCMTALYCLYKIGRKYFGLGSKTNSDGFK